MKFLATVIMLAATVLGRPVADTLQTFTSPDGLRIRNVGYQGDGFYLATFDENNVATVDFTPLTELNSTILASYNSQVAASNNKLNERSELVARGSTCGDDGIVSDLDHANVQLAQNGNGKWYNKDAWGWVSIMLS